MFDYTLIITAALFAGILNAMAGGGSFLAFPALVYIGVPPIAANATSAVAVFPGYLSSTLGFLEELKALNKKVLLTLMIIATVGGVLGALLLLNTSPALFNSIVPWLLIFATLLFAFDKKIKEWAQLEMGSNSRWKNVATLIVAIYGGYFNGGLGIILLALFSVLGYRDLNQMNGLKNALSFILSFAAVTTFAFAELVHWHEAIIMMVAATIGGYLGAIWAKKLPVQYVRAIVIFVGFGMSGAFMSRLYL